MQDHAIEQYIKQYWASGNPERKGCHNSNLRSNLLSQIKNPGLGNSLGGNFVEIGGRNNPFVVPLFEQLGFNLTTSHEPSVLLSDPRYKAQPPNLTYSTFGKLKNQRDQISPTNTTILSNGLPEDQSEILNFLKNGKNNTLILESVINYLDYAWLDSLFPVVNTLLVANCGDYLGGKHPNAPPDASQLFNNLSKIFRSNSYRLDVPHNYLVGIFSRIK